MKLQQGQTWQLDDQYYRITHLERLEVQYKLITDLTTRKGTHYHVTKKDFCRLIQKAVLLPPPPPAVKVMGSNEQESPPLP